MGTMAKIVIIGGGVGGLSAGIYARKAGHEVVICEQNQIAGGNLTGWQRGEYHIDNCIHWLTGTNPNTETYQTWVELGALGTVPIYQPEALFTCESKGEKISAYRNLNRFEQEMLRLSPQDEKEILSLTHAIRAAAAWLGTPLEQNFGLVKRLQYSTSLLKYFRLSTEELGKRFQHPLLKKMPTCMLGKDFTALALIITLAVFCADNGGLPQGNSLAMAQRITHRFCELGGILMAGNAVTKLHKAGRRITAVELANGEILPADYVICACDPKPIFEKALGEKMPQALQAVYNNPKLKRFSSLHVAFACDIADLSFRGDYIFELPLPYKRLLQSHFLVLREFSHEESFAPKGKTVLQALVFCDEKTAKEYIDLRANNKPAYRAKKREFTESVQTVIYEKFPALRGKLQTIDCWTPATYHRYTGAQTGEYMSFILPKGKLPTAVKSKASKYQNLFLATQWQQSPGGLPTAAALGKKAANEIIKRERVKSVFSPKSKPARKATQ